MIPEPYLRRADEGTHSRLIVESCIMLAAARTNPASVLRDAASTYKLDTETIAAKVKQEFAAKAKAKKASSPKERTEGKQPSKSYKGERQLPPLFYRPKFAQ